MPGIVALAISVALASGATACAGAGSSTPTKPATAPPASESRSSAPPRAVFGRTVRAHFTGNHELDDTKLRAVLHIDKSLPDDASTPPSTLLERDPLFVTALYYDHGYMQIELGPTTVTEATDGPFVDVTFTVKNEGKRIRIRRLSVHEREDGAEQILSDDEARRRFRPRSGDWFSRIVLVEDLTKLRTFYRDQGYADVEAEPQTDLDVREGTVALEIPIVRGPLVTIETIVIEGNSKTPTDRVKSELRIREGERFHETRLQESKTRLESLFRRVEVTTERGSSPERLKVTFEVAEK